MRNGYKVTVYGENEAEYGRNVVLEAVLPTKQLAVAFLRRFDEGILCIIEQIRFVFGESRCGKVAGIFEKISGFWQKIDHRSLILL